ncbi:MAG: Smr/MutS family protein [Alphaproteobacteria bacterium]
MPLAAGAAPGLDKRTAQRLRRGQIRIEGRIDLHGMTRVEAYRNLSDFLKSSAAGGRRCVLVITGKGLSQGAGSGILRAEFPRWLNEPALRPLILSFAPAQPRDGGGGAFYVYLRRDRAS